MIASEGKKEELPPILITGAGMVGVQTVKLLYENYGIKPAVMDISYNWPFINTIIDEKYFTAFEGSVFDAEPVESILKEYGIKRVLHTAAVLPMRVGHGAHPGFFQVNTWGSANLMFSCVKNEVERFVMFSTNSVYQFRKFGVEEKVTEDYPVGLNENNSYGNSKAVAEYLLREFISNGEIDGKIIRPGEIYGPVMTSDEGDRIYWKDMVDAAVADKPFVLKNHPEHRLDWVYCEDVAELACRLLLAQDTPNTDYNVSYGECLGIYDIKKVLDSLFPGNKIKLENCREGGWNYPLSGERAFKDLGFAPVYDLSRGIGKYIDWYEGSCKR